MEEKVEQPSLNSKVGGRRRERENFFEFPPPVCSLQFREKKKEGRGKGFPLSTTPLFFLVSIDGVKKKRRKKKKERKVFVYTM